MKLQYDNIFLVGFMGAGKSTVGRRLARQIGYDFADLDQLIVAREGRPIPEIFSSQGEAYFRDCETAVLVEQSKTSRTVFATGGGIVVRQENRELLNTIGKTVYLRSTWPTLVARLQKGSGRPLADPEKGWDSIRRLWESRLPWYEEADLVVDTDRLRVQEVVRQIITRLRLKGLAP